MGGENSSQVQAKDMAPEPHARSKLTFLLEQALNPPFDLLRICAVQGDLLFHAFLFNERPLCQTPITILLC